jgi:prepilin-type processing-associated H-X9-DG protein
MVEVLVIIAIIGVIIGMLFPVLIKKQSKSSKTSCAYNLKIVGLAFRIWTSDNNDNTPTTVSQTNGGAMEAVLTGNVAAVFQVMSNELQTPKLLLCPMDKKRAEAKFFRKQELLKDGQVTNHFLGNSNISFFVGLDANDLNPKMFLAGDDNFLVADKAVQPGVISLTTNVPVAWSDERHERQGNVGLADGSVQGFSSSALRRALANTGDETNRLAFP